MTLSNLHHSILVSTILTASFASPHFSEVIAFEGKGQFGKMLGGVSCERHGEVENCLHGVKDKEYDEDKHVLGRKSWGETWTVLTNIAVSLTNLLHQGERTLREVREKCSHNPVPTARKLGWKS